ncbi:MAG: hypothetical protein JSV18_02395 [Candidatus Bathyarchaeota archaeon]|nr:MAG: hypothetical protein JSV18_02395 [Candidatus Bathyarchaeota archaeon]
MTLEFVLDIQRWGGGEPTAVGEGYSWIYEGKYYSVLYTRGGMFRGNHIHPNNQHTLLLKGRGKYVFRVNGKNVDYPLEEGKILDVPAGVPHILLPEEDCLSVEWWDGMFEAEEFDFPEFTAEINERIEEFDRKAAELKKEKQ